MGMDFAASICWYRAWEVVCNFIWIVVDIKKIFWVIFCKISLLTWVNRILLILEGWVLLSFAPHLDSKKAIQLLFGTIFCFHFISYNVLFLINPSLKCHPCNAHVKLSYWMALALSVTQRGNHWIGVSIAMPYFWYKDYYVGSSSTAV